MSKFFNHVVIGNKRALTLLVEAEGSMPNDVMEAVREIAKDDIENLAGSILGEQFFSLQNVEIAWRRPSEARSLPDKYPGIYVW